MNVFEKYLKEIKETILKNLKELNIKDFENFEGVSVEIPPTDFDFDLSCNVSMVLGKKVKENPKDLGNKIREILLKKCP